MNPGCCAKNSPVVWGLLSSQDANEGAAVRATWGYVGLSLDYTSLDFLPVFYLHRKCFYISESHRCSCAHPGFDFTALLDEACRFLSFWKWDVCYVTLLLYFIEFFLSLSAFSCNRQTWMNVRRGLITVKMMKCAGIITEASDAIPETPVRRLTPKPLKGQWTPWAFRRSGKLSHRDLSALAVAVSADLRPSVRASRPQSFTSIWASRRTGTCQRTSSRFRPPTSTLTHTAPSGSKLEMKAGNFSCV